MLQIVIPETELYDESSGEFVYTKRYVLQLEHSLVSISKWESKWEKPFLTDERKSTEETIDYYRCMTLTKGVPSEAYYAIPPKETDRISKYISAKMTATWIKKDQNHRPSREIITSEVIYYWMVAHQIPFECEKWHLNRLLMLIQVCNEKNKDPKKVSKSEAAQSRRALNAARRAKLNTRG